MRKIILTLAVVLVAVPAMADVKLVAELDAGNSKKVWIKYESDEAQKVRAFALNITATDGNIIDINDFSVGDNNGGYGIFPGTFRDAPIAVNPTTGQVDNWNVAGYSPLAPAGDPEAEGDIPGPAITIECGSLYTDAGPDMAEGYLCTVTVDDTATLVCITGNAIRGNVVMEDASEATTDLTEACVVIPSDECIPSSGAYALQYANWVLLGKPDCWCADYGADGAKGNQCYGDAAGDVYSRGYVVYTTDLTALSDSWKAKIGEANLDPCADFAHDTYSRGYVVYTTDLNILAAHWKKKVGEAPIGNPGDCPLNDADNAARL